jgi:hypothetical protein
VNLLHRIGFCLFIGLLWLVGGTLALARGGHTPALSGVNLPAHLRPGQPLPAGAICNWYPYSYSVCYGQWRTFYFTYDARQGTIVHVSTWLYERGLTAGDLILAWGQPTGYQAGPLPVLFWSGRYVYLIGRTFAPDNRVGALVWDTEPRGEPWRGFRSRQ